MQTYSYLVHLYTYLVFILGGVEEKVSSNCGYNKSPKWRQLHAVKDYCWIEWVFTFPNVLYFSSVIVFTVAVINVSNFVDLFNVTSSLCDCHVIGMSLLCVVLSFSFCSVVFCYIQTSFTKRLLTVLLIVQILTKCSVMSAICHHYCTSKWTPCLIIWWGLF